MISQKLNLFYAGFATVQPSLHYNREALYQKVSKEVLPQDYSNCLQKLKSLIENTSHEAESHINTACHLARHFNIEIATVPRSLNAYFTWQGQICNAFEERFPMHKIDHYYFLYGRKNAEIMTNAGLMQSYLDIYFGMDHKVEIWTGFNKCLKDTEYILFKLIAASTLLSSEPRQGQFTEHYKNINEAFRIFRNLEPAYLKEVYLLKLKNELVNFEDTVISGLKRCMKLMSNL